MRWRDLLYFSKGERQALTLLTSLITMAWIAIIYTDYSQQNTVKNQSEKNDIAQKRDTVFIVKQNTPIAAKTITPKTITPKNRILDSFQKNKFQQKKKQRIADFTKQSKFAKGTIIELNSADTVLLKKIPGIGSVFANRIIKYRNLLGGFYSITQLSEVYGIDEVKFNNLSPWFNVDPSLIKPIKINKCSLKTLASHPYINYKQAMVLHKLVRRKGNIQTLEELSLLTEFSEKDWARLKHYLSIH